jgi:hypothetical protein
VDDLLRAHDNIGFQGALARAKRLLRGHVNEWSIESTRLDGQALLVKGDLKGAEVVLRRVLHMTGEATTVWPRMNPGFLLRIVRMARALVEILIQQGRGQDAR